MATNQIRNRIYQGRLSVLPRMVLSRSSRPLRVHYFYGRTRPRPHPLPNWIARSRTFQRSLSTSHRRNGQYCHKNWILSRCNNFGFHESHVFKSEAKSYPKLEQEDGSKKSS